MPVLAGLYLLKAMVTAALVLSFSFPPAAVAGLVVADCAISGSLMVVMYQLSMSYAARERAVTDYGLRTSLEAILRQAGGLISGQGAIYSVMPRP